MKRHKKAVENARCCWICGKLGGGGFTLALELLGYEIRRLDNGTAGYAEIAYAHPNCIARAAKQRAARREAALDRKALQNPANHLSD